MMRVSLRSVLAAAAAIVAASAVVPAMAEDGQVHVLTVQLPGGGIEQIRYTGDVPPRVAFVPTPAMVGTREMAADPFAALERIFAIMDRQADAMLRQVQSMVGGPAGMLPGLPPGANGYSFVSTMSGSGVCMRSVRITYSNGNATPQVVSSTSGDCGRGIQSPSEVTAPAPVVRPGSKTIEVKATGVEPFRQVAWNH
jgi:hypothetical protein